ncbi:hypothetical protein [Moritella sp. 28]|uniref:hypothetical protein n=1 Tax=Moritella sp. 28 TaxID=2746232 RepID=UPI00351D38E8
MGSKRTKYLQRCNTQITGRTTKLFFLYGFCIDNFRQIETHLHRHFKKNRLMVNGLRLDQ